MNFRNALECLGHLAHKPRFLIVKKLVRAGDAGMTLKGLERELGLSRGAVRRHVRHLAVCGLVRTQEHQRAVVCTANAARLQALTAFLAQALTPELTVAPAPPRREPVRQTSSSDHKRRSLFSSLRDRLDALEEPDDLPEGIRAQADTTQTAADRAASGGIRRLRGRRRRSLTAALSSLDEDA